MAHPIYSFKSKKSRRQYFLVWNTFSGYPQTVPLNLLQFIQYKGHLNEEFLTVFLDVYPKLLQYGSTIVGNSFDELPQPFINQIFELTNLSESDVDPTDMSSALNELESLIVQDDKLKVLSAIKGFFKRYNTFLPRPKNYYLSWHQIMISQIEDDPVAREIAMDILNKSGTIVSKKDIVNLDHWFKSGFFSNKKEIMAKIFLTWAKNNRIELTTIPHILRNSPDVKLLFEEYGLENYLPTQTVEYSLTEQSLFELIRVKPGAKEWKQFFNYSKFCDFGIRDNYNNIVFTGKTLEELEAIADKQYIFRNFINFKNQYGNMRYPMIHAAFFEMHPEDKLIFMTNYGIQSISVALQTGEIIDPQEYYEIESYNNIIGENLPYYTYIALCHDALSRIKGTYNPTTGSLKLEKLESLDYGEE